MSDDPQTPVGGLDLTDEERAALHDCQLGIEHVHRAYGSLLEFHHRVGHAMDRFHDAEERLRSAGHEDLADELRDRHLATGIVDDRWSYEVVEAFERDFVDPIDGFEGRVRDRLADGQSHVSERHQQRAWRARSDAFEHDDVAEE